MIEWINDTGTDKFTGNYGFIYRLIFDDGCEYIGKKSFISTTKKPFGKKKLAAITDKRAKKYEVVVKESNWIRYESSCKDIGDRKLVEKHIIKVCKTKQDLSYWENYYLYGNEVLFNDKFINRNIEGRYYCPKLTGSKE